MTSFIAAGGSGRSISVIPAVPAASSVTTIAFMGSSPRLFVSFVVHGRTRMIVCPLIRSEHDLHVLLRHRLLREADGFESLGTVRVLLAASCPFPTDEPYLPTLHSHFNSA